MLLLKSIEYKVVFSLFVITKLSLVFAGVSYYKKISAAYKLVVWHGAISLLAEIIGYVISSYKLHNTWVFNIYVLLDYTLMGYAALLLMNKARFNSVLYYIWSILPFFLFWDIYEHSIYSLCVNFITLFYLVISVVFFYIMIVNTVFKPTAILKSPIFWLSISIVLYHGCTLPIWIIYKYAIDIKSSTSATFYTINNIINIFRYPLAAYAVYLAANDNTNNLQVSSKYI